MGSAMDDNVAPDEQVTPLNSIKTSTNIRPRSLSDSANAPPALGLAPSPTFREHRDQRDHHDHVAPSTPKPIRRPDMHARGLSLQMPATHLLKDMHSPAQRLSNPSQSYAVPLSPRLDERNIFADEQDLSASPATSLPRHSRGLDFSRASTNLHHSTLADKRSPESSPVIMQRGMVIPARNSSITSMMLDSPNMANQMASNSIWGSLGPDRSTLSSSVGSVNMLGSESEDPSSDDEVSMSGDMDNDDPIFTTPQVHKLQNPGSLTPFQSITTPTLSSTWVTASTFSPAQASLMRTIRRTKMTDRERARRKRSSSASGSGYSSIASPRTTSPPPLKSIESGATGGYFRRSTAARSRRESLAIGTEGLHLSSGNDSGDEAAQTTPNTPGVVRRIVTRRNNLLPKTKGFARIRAALLEEAAPVDTEVRREAETIRQVRERDVTLPALDLVPDRPGSGTAASSPSLLPAVPECAQEGFDQDICTESHDGHRGLGMNFATNASRNSGGLEYWSQFDHSFRTPPPQTLTRNNSSVMSDMNCDPSSNDPWRPRAQSSASDMSEVLGSNGVGTSTQQTNLMNDDMHLKKFKRRREDDFDIATIKRRAVSPGMSTQNSPVLTQSPQRDTSGPWGGPPEKRKDSLPMSASSDPGLHASTTTPQPLPRSSSNGSSSGCIALASQGKKLGLKGMVDTNDGLMKMSIE